MKVNNHMSKYVGATAMAAVWMTAFPAFAQCLVFQGNQACSVGQAILTVDGDRLLIGGLRKNGQDGLSSRFTGATSWSSDISAVNSSPGDTVRFTAMANGEVASNLKFTRTSIGLRIRTGFTGAAVSNEFTVLILSQGEIAATFTGNTGTTILAQVVDSPDFPWPFPFPFPRPDDDPEEPVDFEIVAATGACAWDVEFANAMMVTVNGQQAAGDQIRIVENVGPGHYPYVSFNGVRVQSSSPAMEATIINVTGD
ncbi:MAG: hypothetical protein AAF449_09110 [Myxococcota bacterium]